MKDASPVLALTPSAPPTVRRRVDPITVFLARKVTTMDAGRPVADAIAVKGGRVLSTRTLESTRPWLSTDNHTIDPRVQDEVMMPGFIEPHTHLATSAGFLAVIAAAEPAEQKRAQQILRDILPVSSRRRGFLVDARFVTAPQAIAVDTIRAPTVVGSVEDDHYRSG